METRTGSKTVVTSPTVEFLLKQVYAAYKEKVRGLEAENHSLKLELQHQKNSCEDCKQCKVLKDELKKCKESFLEILSDQKKRIELLVRCLVADAGHGRLKSASYQEEINHARKTEKDRPKMQLCTQQIPASKNKMSFHSRKNEESLCEKVSDDTRSEKQKKSEEPEFLNPPKLVEQKFPLIVRTEHSENENSILPKQPLPSIIVPETLDVDINDDADITVLAIYDKRITGTTDAKLAVPESVDTNLVELAEHREHDAAFINNEITEVTTKDCNRRDHDDKVEANINSSSLLPPLAVLGKAASSVMRAKESDKKNSTTNILVDGDGAKSEHEDDGLARDIMSPSLISPPKKKPKLCLDVTNSNEQEVSDVSCSHLSSCSDRNFLCDGESSLVDMDETYFPLPVIRCKLKQNLNMGDDDAQITEVGDVPDVLIVKEGQVLEEKSLLTQVKEAKNPVTEVIKPVAECSFDRLPEKECVKYKFKEETVRKREDRARLLGHPCKQCEEYYDQLDMPGSEKAKRITKCSRHRSAHKPPATPEHYWELTFPDTQECKARGYVKETQVVQLRPRRRRPLELRKDK